MVARIFKDLPIFKALGAVGQNLNPQKYGDTFAPVVDILGTAGYRRESLVENTFTGGGVGVAVTFAPPQGRVWRVVAAGISDSSGVLPTVWISMRMVSTSAIRCSIREPFAVAGNNIRYPVNPFWWPGGTDLILESDNAGSNMTFNCLYVDLALGEYVAT